MSSARVAADTDTPLGLRGHLAMACATACGLGYLRPAPGSWAAAAAAALAWAWLALAPGSLTLALWAGTLLATLGGLASCGTAIRRLGVLDPSEVVIDEVAGMWLALAVLPPQLLLASGPMVILSAWLAFRVFDIGKPWPVSWLEHIPGAAGIIIDDLAAGVLAGMLTLAVFH